MTWPASYSWADIELKIHGIPCWQNKNCLRTHMASDMPVKTGHSLSSCIIMNLWHLIIQSCLWGTKAVSASSMEEARLLVLMFWILFACSFAKMLVICIYIYIYIHTYISTLYTHIRTFMINIYIYTYYLRKLFQILTGTHCNQLLMMSNSLL